MQSDLPFYEDASEALAAAVQALGGAKQVGAMLWPDKSPDSARTRLLDCLNNQRAERLDLSEAMFILRKARDKGMHAPFSWMCGELGYEQPRPMTTDAEVDRLTTVVDNAAKVLAAAIPQLERMQRARAAA